MRERDDRELRDEDIALTVPIEARLEVPPRERELSRAARRLVPLTLGVDVDGAGEPGQGEEQTERHERARDDGDAQHCSE